MQQGGTVLTSWICTNGCDVDVDGYEVDAVGDDDNDDDHVVVVNPVV